MRALTILLCALLAACQQEAPEETERQVASPPAMATYVGQGRDRLCLDEQAGRVGLISYGSGDANCSLRGTVTGSGDRLTIMPDGDQSCRLSATASADTISIGGTGPSCAYYCGPGATLSARTFRRSGEALPVTDLAGDPLC